MKNYKEMLEELNNLGESRMKDIIDNKATEKVRK